MNGMDQDLRELINEARANSLAREADADAETRRLALLDRQEDARLLRKQIPRVFDLLPDRELLDGRGVKGQPDHLPPLHKPYRDEAEHWCPSSGNLLLTGPSGLGKTRAAAALVRRLLRLGSERGGPDWKLVSRMVWAWVPILERKRREHPMGRGEAPEVDQAMTASLLVLDDFGQGQYVEATRDVLEERYSAGLPTVTTSGFMVAQLSERFPMVVRRLLETGGRAGTVVNGFGGAK